MTPSEALHRIQSNAQAINALLENAPNTPTAEIRDRAQLIERETAQLSALLIETKGNA